MSVWSVAMGLDIVSEGAGKPRRHLFLCAHCLERQPDSAAAWVYTAPHARECMRCTHPTAQILIGSWPRTAAELEALCAT